MSDDIQEATPKKVRHTKVSGTNDTAGVTASIEAILENAKEIHDPIRSRWQK